MKGCGGGTGGIIQASRNELFKTELVWGNVLKEGMECREIAQT